MFAIIGIVLVFGAVIGGFLMEKGHLAVLVQPAEVLIIAGAALGTLLTANPLHILKQIVGALLGTLGSSKFGKPRYLSTLKMMFDLLNKVRRGGLLSIESDIEQPTESEIFKQYPDFLKDHHVCHFVCDTMRMIVTGGVEPFDMDQMMELDMDVSHHDGRRRSRRSRPSPTPCLAWALWQPCSESSSPWAHWPVLPKSWVRKSPRHWWEPSSAFCCATEWSAR